MATAASLQVVVGADIAGALRGLGQVSRSVASSSRSFVSSAASTAVGFTGAAIGLDALGGAASFVQRALGVGLANELEGLTARFEAMLGGSEAAGDMLAYVRKRADETPRTFSELGQAVTGLIPIMKSTKAPIDELLNTALILAEVDPAQGLAGAGTALREFAGGDLNSLKKRFEIDTDPIERLVAKGVPGLKALQQVLAQNGFTMDLVEKRAKTTEGRFSTFSDLLDSIFIQAGKPILGALGLELDRAGGIITKNLPALQAFWATIGSNIGGAIGSTGEALGTLLTTATNLSKVHDIPFFKALETAATLRIGEVFGEDAATRFRELIDGIEKLPEDIAEFKKSIASIPLEIAKITEAFKLLVINLANIPVLGNAFKGTAAEFRRELGLLPQGVSNTDVSVPSLVPGAGGHLVPNPTGTPWRGGEFPTPPASFPQAVDNSIVVDMTGVTINADDPNSLEAAFQEYARRLAAAQKHSANAAGPEAPGS